MTKKYCIYSNKGGVGKTTLTISMAHALVLAGSRVCLIDLDSQSNLSRHLGCKAAPTLSIQDVLRERCEVEDVITSTAIDGLSLVPGNQELDNLPLLYPKIMRQPNVLRTKIAGMQGFDYIFIDCPASFNWITRLALYAAGELLVPVQAEPYALQGLGDLAGSLQRMQAIARIHKIIINMYRSHTQLHSSISRTIEHLYPGIVARQKVRQNIQLGEAAAGGSSIFTYAPTSAGAMDIFALCYELFDMNQAVEEAEAILQAASE